MGMVSRDGKSDLAVYGKLERSTSLNKALEQGVVRERYNTRCGLTMLLFSVINDGYFGIIQIYMWPWGKYEHDPAFTQV